MGKIKQKRHVFHLSAPKASSNDEKLIPSEQSSNRSPVISFEKNFVPKSNIFQNVTIPSHILKQKLPAYSRKDEGNFKVTEILSRQDFQEYLKKRQNEGLSVRRKKFPFDLVVSSANEFLRKFKKEKKKNASAILNNFQAMEDALPTLQELIKESKIRNQEDRPRAAKSFSRQNAEMMQDIQTYHQVLNDSQYASDPFGTITAQLKQKLQADSL